MVCLKFGKELRLTRRPQFLKCYSQGRRYHTSTFILFIRENSLEHFRVGIAVTRKIGPAVRRNRIKRLVRECFRTHQHHIRLKADIVVVCKKKPGLKMLDQKTVNQELLTLISRLNPKDSKEHMKSPSCPASDPD